MSTFEVARLQSDASDFWQRLDALTAWSEERDMEVAGRVAAIIRVVREQGDAALVQYTNQFDHRQVQTAAELVVEAEQWQAALADIPVAQPDALQAAAERVRAYHENQDQPARQYDT